MPELIGCVGPPTTGHSTTDQAGKPLPEPYAKVTQAGWFTWRITLVIPGTPMRIDYSPVWGLKRAMLISEKMLAAYLNQDTEPPPVAYVYDANGWRRWTQDGKSMDDGKELP